MVDTHTARALCVLRVLCVRQFYLRRREALVEDNVSVMQPNSRVSGWWARQVTRHELVA